MAYSSWSVVFGEQPSAAKWNILGTNDASFNDGTGIANGRYQTDNSDSISSVTGAVLIRQNGWGQKNGDGTTSMTEAVSFPEAFTTILGVACSPLGVKAASAMSSITDASTTDGTHHSIAPISITTSGFTANLRKGGTTFTSGTRYAYSWTAWGL